MNTDTINADTINAHLTNGGMVQVTTYTRSWVYEKKHAGWFTTGKDGCLYVRQGKGKVCLGHEDRILVSIRFSKI